MPRELLMAEREAHHLRDGCLLEAAAGDGSEVVDRVHADEQRVRVGIRVGPLLHALDSLPERGQGGPAADAVEHDVEGRSVAVVVGGDDGGEQC